MHIQQRYNVCYRPFREPKPDKTLGTTKPISVQPPTQMDRKMARHLEKVIKAANLVEDHEEASNRELVLTELNEMCQRWVKQVTLNKNMSHQMVDETRVRLYTFGSFRLGVHNTGADIDVLCVGPKHVTHYDFFNSWVEMLKENYRVSDILAVPESYVPLCKFKFDSVDIDMVYARVQLDVIDAETFDIFDNRNLKNADAKSVMSLNGARVTDRILSLVPDTQVFRKALRAIKHWAKQRAIYSNVMGYLGGVSWAILTARVCQLYPKSNAASIIVRFFRFYDLWQFGYTTPIVLDHIENDRELGFPIWDPTNNSSQKLERMAIITPAYPAINSTFRVSQSTFQVLKAEFKRAKEVTSPDKKKRSSYRSDVGRTA